MTPKEVIAKVKKVEISTKKLVDGLVAGNYHSVFKGNGIEFAEIREYRPGDDIRTIDWNVTARFDKPFVKEFMEERDLRVYVAIDASGSEYFGTDIEKRTRAIELAATLFFSALRNNDKAGMFLFTDSLELFVPARKGKKHVLKMISRLVTFEPASRKTDIQQSLAAISKLLKRRSILFLISDFVSEQIIDASSSWQDSGRDYEEAGGETSRNGLFALIKTLRMLSRKHDVIAVRIYDKHEMEIPEMGLVELEDEETGEQILLNTSDPEFRKNYMELVARYESSLESAFRKARVDSFLLDTAEPFEKPLIRFFKMRKMKLAR
ncbi:DUF58 domain-containing protein [Candidatus Woesearchaeota archaeon]|nr:MAG: DUF58 domain-containing protein [Candidatus Woesearchaeota archaeon]